MVVFVAISDAEHDLRAFEVFKSSEIEVIFEQKVEPEAKRHAIGYTHSDAGPDGINAINL